MGQHSKTLHHGEELSTAAENAKTRRMVGALEEGQPIPELDLFLMLLGVARS